MTAGQRDNDATVSPLSTPVADTTGLAAEVERLRTLLERQPSCLIRVAVDGTLLAVNEAALSLLGASELGQVLDSSLVECIEDGRTTWSGFIQRVANGGSASLECEMTDRTGARRAVILQAVMLPAHPDGHESLLVTVRDVSTSRRLQASLQEQEALRRSAQQQLEQVTEEREQLRAALEQLQAALNTALDATLRAQQVVDRRSQA